MKKKAITLSGHAPYCQTGMVRLDIGQTVASWPDYCARFGQLDFLNVLEHFRPTHMLSHHQAVVMHASVEDLENSSGDEWLYELNVAPESTVQRHDLNWANEIATLIAAREPGTSEAIFQSAALKYWSGEASHHPIWEYLAAQAVVVAVHDY